MKIGINFSSVGFGKVFAGNKNISVDSTDKDSVGHVADILSQVDLPQNEPTGFTSIPELIGLEYVGYVIEKERYDPNTKEWNKIDEYKIIGSKSNVFRDTRVAYGYSYRYRMKSVVKITVKKISQNAKNLEFLTDLRDFTSSKINSKITNNKDFIIQMLNEGNSGLESKTSTGVTEKSVKISDHTKVVLGDDNSLKFINSDLGDEQVIDFNEGVMSDELFLKSLNDLVVEQEQEKDVEYISYYYESVPEKDWTVVDVVKLIPPEYPQDIKIFPNSNKKEIVIIWNKPVSEVEVKFYNVYRRNKMGEPWTIIAEGLQEFEIVFVDKNVNFGNKYIYAITSIDIHGIESFLSTQIQTELNTNIVVEGRERDLVWISGGGTTIEEINFELKK